MYIIYYLMIIIYCEIKNFITYQVNLYLIYFYIYLINSNNYNRYFFIKYVKNIIIIHIMNNFLFFSLSSCSFKLNFEFLSIK